eukprot:TRINITY_DN33990_c0_g1_i1.p1 TRINITY_DN33990_c0_g1~~TRINITY_DN33990_c0_g1_i1.p1  ORF type:complete len:1183 (+),score=287.02 TRINITY_DN33990_c0_g1_i1:42-3551(+)
MARVSSHEEGPTRLILSKDGKEVFTGGADAMVNVFEFEMVFKGSKWARQYEGNSEQITCLAVDKSQDGRFAVGGQDGVVNLYEPGHPPRVIFRQAACIVYGCAFSPSGENIAIASDNGLRVLSTLKGNETVTEITSPLDRGEAVLTTTWHSSNFLICGATSGIYAWDMSSKKPVHKPFSKDHALTQPRQRNETISHSLPEITVMGSPAFAYPKGKAVIVQPLGKGNPATIAIPDLEGSHEAYLIAAQPKSEIIAVLDDLNYLTFIDLSTMQVVERMRPLLGSENEEITDLVWHPTEPTAVLVATSSGSVQMLCGVYDLPDKKPKATVKPKHGASQNATTTVLPKGHLDDEEDDDDSSSEEERRVHRKEKKKNRFLDDEASEDEGDEDSDADMQEDAGMEGMSAHMTASRPDLDNISELSTIGGAPIRVRERQLPFQIGQTPPPGHPGTEGARILCWNKIGYVRNTVTEDATHIVVNFYDKAKYSTLRFSDHKTEAPLSMACLGRNGVLLASSTASSEHSNRLTYRSVISWGTNPDWTHTLTNEVPQAVALGDLWAVCFTDQYMRVFRHSGVASMIISLPHRVICSIGMEATMNPVCGDIPLNFAPQDTIAYAHENAGQVEVNMWNLSTKAAVRSGVPVPLSKDSTVTWMGWADEGMLAVQDSNQVIRVLSSNFGASWIPVYDPKATQTFERLHVLNIRSGVLSGVVVTHGVGPDPRVDDHTVVRRQLGAPVLTDRPAPWPEKEGANIYTNLLLDEKKARAQCYTADIAKLEVKQDNILTTLFKETLNSSQTSTTRALDLATMFNMKDHLEAAMQIAYDQSEERLYGKMRRVFESEFGAKKTRKNRLPDKPKQNKEEKLTSWVKQLKETEKDLRTRLADAESQMLSQAQDPVPVCDDAPMPTSIDVEMEPVERANNPAPLIGKTNSFFAPIAPKADEPLDALGGLRYVEAPNEKPDVAMPPVSTTPAKPLLNAKAKAPVAVRKRKAEITQVAEKKPRKEKKETKKGPVPDEKEEEKEKEQDWWEVDGRHADEMDKPVEDGLITHDTQSSVDMMQPLPTPTPLSVPVQDSVPTPTPTPLVVPEPVQKPVPAPSSNNGANKLLALKHVRKPQLPAAPKYASGGLKEIVLPEKKVGATPAVSSNFEKAKRAAERVGAPDDSDSDDGFSIAINK